MTYKVVEQEERIQQLRHELNDMYQRWIRCSNFIESASSYTNDWDDMCDCNMLDGEHDKDCMSIKFRIDQIYALTEKRFEDGN